MPPSNRNNTNSARRQPYGRAVDPRLVLRHQVPQIEIPASAGRDSIRSRPREATVQDEIDELSSDTESATTTARHDGRSLISNTTSAQIWAAREEGPSAAGPIVAAPSVAHATHTQGRALFDYRAHDRLQFNRLLDAVRYRFLESDCEELYAEDILDLIVSHACGISTISKNTFYLKKMGLFVDAKNEVDQDMITVWQQRHTLSAQLNFNLGFKNEQEKALLREQLGTLQGYVQDVFEMFCAGCLASDFQDRIGFEEEPVARIFKKTPVVTFRPDEEVRRQYISRAEYKAASLARSGRPSIIPLATPIKRGKQRPANKAQMARTTQAQRNEWKMLIMTKQVEKAEIERLCRSDNEDERMRGACLDRIYRDMQRNARMV